MILNLNIKIFNKNYLTDENGNYPSEKINHSSAPNARELSPAVHT